MAVVGQMLLNQGSYGDLRFFAEETYEALLPVDLEHKIVISQSRMDGGKLYHEYLNRAYLLLEKYFDH